MLTQTHRSPFYSLILAMVMCAPLHAAGARGTDGDGFVHEPTSSYEERTMHGFRVMVSGAARANPETTNPALELLETELKEVAEVVPTKTIETLRTIPIWVEHNNPGFPCACYHPSADWLRKNGYNVDKADSVEIANPANFVAWVVETQPMMVLHELAHGYHDVVFGYDDAIIRKTFEHAARSGIYDRVKHVNGKIQRHYALTNPMEYFAELSESYFGKNDFYPFTRAELREHDPVGYAMVERAWSLDPTTVTPRINATHAPWFDIDDALRAAAAQGGSGEIRPAVEGLDDYKLVWQDGFDGAELDLTKWNHSRLGPRRDAVNVKEAISVDGKGHLRITTFRVDDDAMHRTPYRTGMIDTRGIFETTFGYFEIRAKLQREHGHWSAFWLQTPTMGDPLGEPEKAGVEIDIMEFHHEQQPPESVHHTLHWDGYGEHHRSVHHLQTVKGVTEGFHTFSLLWTESEYVFYVDGHETWRTTRAVSKRDQYMILSLEVGKWAGDIGGATLPDSLVVDHVRVFKRAE